MPRAPLSVVNPNVAAPKPLNGKIKKPRVLAQPAVKGVQLENEPMSAEVFAKLEVYNAVLGMKCSDKEQVECLRFLRELVQRHSLQPQLLQALERTCRVLLRKLGLAPLVVLPAIFSLVDAVAAIPAEALPEELGGLVKKLVTTADETKAWLTKQEP
mmetsp:Transcript_17050/g.19052  ORF Transcript_17050/g.19052 Transcript_17050/m.19052 type:complete len:157 (-) Transcript_17050:155-625(-)